MACQVCYSVTKLIVMRRDETALFAIKGVTDRELGLAAVTVCRGVWGLVAIPQEEVVTPFLCPHLRPIYCERLHWKGPQSYTHVKCDERQRPGPG